MSNISKIVTRLKRSYSNSIGEPTNEEHSKFQDFMTKHGIKGWEPFFVPEDFFYDDVLKKVSQDDVIFDVGAIFHKYGSSMVNLIEIIQQYSQLNYPID